MCYTAKKDLYRHMGLEENERVIELTPIGYPDTPIMGEAAPGIIELGAAEL